MSPTGWSAARDRIHRTECSKLSLSKLNSEAYWKSWHAASSTKEERSDIHNSEEIFGTLGLRRGLLSAASNASSDRIGGITWKLIALPSTRKERNAPPAWQQSKMIVILGPFATCSSDNIELSFFSLISGMESPLSTAGQIVSIETAPNGEVRRKSGSRYCRLVWS